MEYSVFPWYLMDSESNAREREDRKVNGSYDLGIVQTLYSTISLEGSLLPEMVGLQKWIEEQPWKDYRRRAIRGTKFELVWGTDRMGIRFGWDDEGYYVTLGFSPPADLLVEIDDGTYGTMQGFKYYYERD
jgi:hypothetical protein